MEAPNSCWDRQTPWAGAHCAPRSHSQSNWLCLQGTELLINHQYNKLHHGPLISCQSDISIIKRFKSDTDYFNHNTLHGAALQSTEETDNSVPWKFLLAFHRLCPLFSHLVTCNVIICGKGKIAVVLAAPASAATGCEKQNPRIIEAGKDLWVESPTCDQPPPCQSDHSTECRIQLFLQQLQGWWNWIWIPSVKQNGHTFILHLQKNPTAFPKRATDWNKFRQETLGYLIIISENPAKPFHVGLHNLATEFLIRGIHVEFVFIVALLPTSFPQPATQPGMGKTC